MYSTAKIGFLFDVDGTLTSIKRNDSVNDILIMNDLMSIRKRKFPIALITGRSIEWVINSFFEHVDDSLKDYFYISGEFGLVEYYQGNIKRRRIPKEVREHLTSAKEELTKEICEYKELEPYVSYTPPDERSLWIEPKEIMITFRTLPLFGLTTDKLLKIIEPHFEKYSETLKIVPNNLAVDILPQFTSKKEAAQKAIKKLDPEKKVEKWFAFGDTDADKLMGKARRIVDFYLIEHGKTSDTHYLIEKALAGYEKLRD